MVLRLMAGVDGGLSWMRILASLVTPESQKEGIFKESLCWRYDSYMYNSQEKKEKGQTLGLQINLQTCVYWDRGSVGVEEWRERTAKIVEKGRRDKGDRW